MTGTAGRSGRPGFDKQIHETDGLPQSPRLLQERAQELFDWLCERLQVDAPGTVWKRLDGTILATVAELMADQEAVAAGLAQDPCSPQLLRLRIQFADRLYKYSSLLGLSPKDRERVPANESEEPLTEWD